MSKIGVIKFIYMLLPLPFTISFTSILFGILNNNQMYYSNGILALIILIFLSLMIYPLRLRLVQQQSWIELHLHMLTVQIVFSILNAIIFFAITSKLNLNSNTYPNDLLFLVILSAFNLSFFLYFHNISNIVGMDYLGYSNKSSFGISNYAVLATKFLEREKYIGLSLLSYSLNSFKKLLENNNDKIGELNTSIRMLENMDNYYNKEAYSVTLDLAESLSLYPKMEEIYKSLNEFSNNRKLKWANKIVSKNERIYFKELLPIVPPVIIALINLLNFIFPKELIPEMVSSILLFFSSSYSSILFIMFYLLFLIFMRIFISMYNEIGIILRSLEKIKI